MLVEGRRGKERLVDIHSETDLVTLPTVPKPFDEMQHTRSASLGRATHVVCPSGSVPLSCSLEDPEEVSRVLRVTTAPLLALLARPLHLLEPRHPPPFSYLLSARPSPSS